MAKFARETDGEILHTVYAKLSWSHNKTLMDRVKNPSARVRYARQSVGNGWSHNVLTIQIESRLYERQALSQKFRPEFTGKLSFYVSAVDGEVAGEGDNPTIGLLLCKSKDDVVAEYALHDINQPIGVSSYRLGDELPAGFAECLPSLEDLQTRI